MAKNDRQVTAVVIGAGQRGKNYSSYALDFPEKFQIVGVAEINVVARNRLQKWFNIPEENAVSDWTYFAKNKIADMAIIATPDRLHKEPAIGLARAGYHLLLEKPMAVTPEDCKEIKQTCSECNVLLAVCHVLRYFPPVITIKESILRGDVGDVVHTQHTERVGFWHFAHSFVRGNWKNTDESCFSLLAKCCHDVDLIKYWMGDKKCVTLSSVGSLFHFKKQNKPVNAGDNCLNCVVEKTCPYSAKKIYLDRVVPNVAPCWPLSVVCDVNDRLEDYPDELKTALLTGAYGKCIYECKNNVCDHQIVNFQYDDGSTATLTMIAYTEELCERETVIYGTKGTLKWNGLTNGPVIFYDFLTQTSKNLKIDQQNTSKNLQGHGGADFYLMDSFVKAVARNDESLIKTGPKDSLESHLLVFAAEESRLTKNTVYYEDYAKHL